MESDRARVGSFSQFGPSSPVKEKIRVLITPHSGLSMKRTEMMVGIDGTAQGNTNRTASIFTHQRLCVKKPDRKSAITIFTLIATIRNTSVFTTVRSTKIRRRSLVHCDSADSRRRASSSAAARAAVKLVARCETSRVKDSNSPLPGSSGAGASEDVRSSRIHRAICCIGLPRPHRTVSKVTAAINSVWNATLARVRRQASPTRVSI